MTSETYPGTIAQAEALSRYLADPTPENNVLAYVLPDSVDLDRLREAVAVVADSTELLRRSLISIDGQWRVFDGDSETPRLAEFALEGVAADTYPSVTRGLAERRFKPTDPHLISLNLITGPAAVLVVVAAPFLIDRFSLGKVIQAISQAYDGDLQERLRSFPQVDLLAQEADYLSSEKSGIDRSFWRALLSKNQFEWRPPRWPTSAASSSFSIALGESTTHRLHELSDRLGLSMDDVLLSSFHIFLSRITGSRRIQTSTAMAGPAHERMAGVGCDERFVILANDVDPNTTLLDFLRSSAKLCSYERYHSEFPSGLLLDDLRSVDPSIKGLTNVTFGPDLRPADALVLNGVATDLLSSISAHGSGDSILIAHAVGTDDVTFRVELGNSEEYEGVRAALPRFAQMLGRIGEHLDGPISAIQFYEPASREKAINDSWGDPLPEVVPSVLRRIASFGTSTPDAVAVTCDDDRVNYAELLAQAAAIARALRPHLTGETDPLVGICMQRGVGMIVAGLGVQLAGAGYVPLDPANPDERLRFILSDSAACALIADEVTREVAAATAQDLPILDFQTVIADAEPAVLGSGTEFVTPAPESVAYVIYTSGTTGRPKGVVVEHRNLDTFVASFNELVVTDPEDRWLQFASLNFDASVLEIYNALACGARLVVAPAAIRTDPAKVHELIAEEKVTHAFIPPAMLRVLPTDPLPALREIFCGGEASDDATVAYWSRVSNLWNCYGPTETTVLSSANRLRGRRASDLGRAMPGYAMYLLDELKEPVPTGGVGEIWVAGNAVTRGYLNRPDLTAAKFVPDPFRPGRMYGTGDLARQLPDGGLEYLGRNDFQVKIRGFRIEIGDIETVIQDVLGVRGTLVTPVEHAGEKQLAAWYTSDDVTPEALRREIEKKLPYYMVPAHLVKLRQFPINIAGKIDRARLKLPTAAESAGNSELNGLDLAVAQIWAEVLALPLKAISGTSQFFHLGGHSLSAAAVCARLTSILHTQVGPRMLFERPTLTDFADALGLLSPQEIVEPPVALDGVTSAPVTDALGNSIWNRSIERGSDNAYTILLRIDLDEMTNSQLLRKVMRETLQENPIFSSALVEAAGRLMLVEQPAFDPMVPLRSMTVRELEALTQELQELAFDLSVAPLWRAEIAVADDRVVLMLAISHIIFDGWSMNILLAEVAARYEARLAGTEYSRTRLSYFDYATWAERLRTSDTWTESVEYWQQKLAGRQAITELPVVSSTPRPESNDWWDFTIDPAMAQRLRDTATRLDVTLSPVLFTVFLIWLWRVTGQQSLMVAYPYAGRDVPGTDEIYGLFVRMGFLCEDIDPDAHFDDLVRRVAEQMLSDRENLTASPYDADLSDVGAPNVIFTLQSGVSLDGRIGGAGFQATEYPSNTPKADITGVFYEAKSGRIEGRIEYDGARIPEPLMLDLVGVLRALVISVASSTDQRLSDLEYLSDSGLGEFMSMAIGPELPADRQTITQVFRQVAARNPSAIALKFRDREISYAELDQASDELARRIVSTFGPAPDQRIGLSVAKSPEVVIGALAILKAGCAYVPLDTSYPTDRLAYIIEDSDATAILADRSGARALQQTGLADLRLLDPAAVDLTGDSVAGDSAVDLPEPTPSSLAYVIYTSGSTGKPKGVMIEHRSVPRLTEAARSVLAFESTSSMALMGTLNFDASVLQVFLPLLTGATLTIVPPDIEKDPELIHAHLNDQSVTHALITPSLIRNLPRRPIDSMQVLCFGGEEIDAGSADFWSAHTRFFSLYGPTETTVMCSAGQVHPGENPRILGKPLPGYRVYLLNPENQPVPAGCVGEIYIGGAGDARGYLGREELSLERFMIDPFAQSPYSMMYRSGDLGRFLPDGTIEFFGRNDNQIKLRGFRIELGEIELAIQRAPGVTEAAADVKGDGDNRAIVGYYTSEAPLDHDALRDSVGQVLPSYMIPTFWVRLEHFQKTANGKLDRKALPDVSRRSSSTDAPRPGTETTVAAIFEKLLRFEGVGRDDDFFQLGGNSLSAARLQVMLNEQLDLQITIPMIYSAPTVAGIAASDQGPSIPDAQRTVQAGVGLIQPVADSGEPDSAAPDRISHVLLTGATGFLGIYLLRELLESVEEVSCLLRAKDEAAGRATLARAAEQAGLVIDLDRVNVLIGDLGTPNLALEPATLDRLSHSVDAIVHCGAWVHHLYSYNTLKAANVGATVELAKLALRTRRKWLTFVSTESVGEQLAGVDSVTEQLEDPRAHPPTMDNGYVLGKWVSEQLLGQVHDTVDLDAVIARPGNITGDSETGYSNFANNHFWLFARGCLQLGAYPDTGALIEMTPVDVLARAIAAVALDRTAGLRVLNLSNPVRIPAADFFTEVAAITGRPLVREPWPVWQARLADIDEGNSLFQIRDFYQGDLTDHAMVVEQERTAATLTADGVSTAVDYPTLIPKYVRYLQSTGFLSPAPD